MAEYQIVLCDRNRDSSITRVIITGTITWFPLAMGAFKMLHHTLAGQTTNKWYEIFDTATGKNALHSPTAPPVERPEWPIGARRGLDVGSFRVELKRVKSANRQAYEVYSQGRMLGLVFKTAPLEWAFTGAAAGVAPRLGFVSSYAACRDLLARYPDHMLESAF